MHDQNELRMGKVWEEDQLQGRGVAHGVLESRPDTRAALPPAAHAVHGRARAVSGFSAQGVGEPPRREGRRVRMCKLISLETEEGRGNLYGMWEGT